MLADRSPFLSLSCLYPYLSELNQNGKVYSIEYTSFPIAYFAEFQVLTMVAMEITAFWSVAPCSLVGSHHHFGKICFICSFWCFIGIGVHLFQIQVYYFRYKSVVELITL
jgi:hypothetical protein